MCGLGGGRSQVCIFQITNNTAIYLNIYIYLHSLYMIVDVPRFVASAGDHISVNYRTSVRMGTVVQVGGDKLPWPLTVMIPLDAGLHPAGDLCGDPGGAGGRGPESGEGRGHGGAELGAGGRRHLGRGGQRAQRPGRGLHMVTGSGRQMALGAGRK